MQIPISLSIAVGTPPPNHACLATDAYSRGSTYRTRRNVADHIACHLMCIEEDTCLSFDYKNGVCNLKSVDFSPVYGAAGYFSGPKLCP